MKLFRYGPPGGERPGVVDDQGRALDVSTLAPDFDGAALSWLMAEPISSAALAGLPQLDLEKERIGPPIAPGGTVWCIGLNYTDHAQEAGMPIPSEPIVFSKPASAVGGPHDPIPCTPAMHKLDWEVELGVVIGRSAYKVPAARALEHVFGYAVVNDVSERAWQLERGGQWIKGKSHPGFCPVGPWLVTADEVPDPQALGLWLSVNDRRMQDASTASMIFPVAALVSYLSQFARLAPGDLICTGTPAGVGAGFKPPIFLKPGDVVALGVEGLGEQRQTVEAS